MMRSTKPRRIANRLSWRQAITLDCIAQGINPITRPHVKGLSLTQRSLWNRLLIGSDYQSLTRLGWKVVVILRQERKV